MQATNVEANDVEFTLIQKETGECELSVTVAPEGWAAATKIEFILKGGRMLDPTEEIDPTA